MDKEQLDIFLEANERATKEAIQKFVNGKIDKIDQKLDAHIARVEPVIKAFEDAKVIDAVATKYGEKVIFIGKVLAAIGALYVAFRLGILQLINKP